jgi:hypothetical protein
MVRHGAVEEAAAYLRVAEGGRHAWRADSMRRTRVGGGANEWRWLESCKQLAQCAQKRDGRGGAFEQAIYAALCGDGVLLADAQRRIAASHRAIHANAQARQSAACVDAWRRRDAPGGAPAPIPAAVEASERKLVALHALQRKWPFVVANYPAAAAAAAAATMRSAHDAMWGCVHCHLVRGEQRRELGSLLDALRETAWVGGAWSVVSRQASVRGAVARAGPALPDNDDAVHGARTYLAMAASELEGWNVAPRSTPVRQLLAPLRGARGAERDRTFFLTLQKRLIEFVATWAERRDASRRARAAPFGTLSVDPTTALCEILDGLADDVATLSAGFRPGALRFAAHFALFHRLTEIRFRAAGGPAAGAAGAAPPRHPLAAVPRHSMFRLIAAHADCFGDEVLRGADIGGAWSRRSLGARHVAMYAATLEDRVEGEAFSRHMVCVFVRALAFLPLPRAPPLSFPSPRSRRRAPAARRGAAPLDAHPALLLFFCLLSILLLLVYSYVCSLISLPSARSFRTPRPAGTRAFSRRSPTTRSACASRRKRRSKAFSAAPRSRTSSQWRCTPSCAGATPPAASATRCSTPTRSWRSGRASRRRRRRRRRRRAAPRRRSAASGRRSSMRSAGSAPPRRRPRSGRRARARGGPTYSRSASKR